MIGINTNAVLELVDARSIPEQGAFLSSKEMKTCG
jgi:hypothetical protein